MSLEEKSDHTEEALTYLLQQYKGGVAPTLESLISILVDQLQELEVAAFDVLLLRFQDTADGEQLDVLGRVVGEDRKGRSDDDFRAAITARIKANRSGGTVEDIIGVVLLLTSNSFEIISKPPAAFQIHFSDALSDDDATNIALMVKASRLAGVNCQLIYNNGDDDDVLTLGDSTLSSSSTQGLADVSKTTGGDAAGVILT